ncbi:MAG: tyrosine-type recombinase/integrase [Burkholderiales bacterium]
MKLWGERKAREIVRRDTIELLDDIVDRGAPIQANRTLACVRRMFNFAVERGILENSPCAGVKAPSSENRRDRVLSEDEIRAFWGSLDQASMTDPVKLALRFQLVTAQRKGEVIAASWDQFDLAAAIWTIPTEKAKNKMAHRVPLSPLALELLKEIRAGSGDSAYLFTSPTRNGHITPTAVDHATRKHMDAFRASDQAQGGILGHLRRTAASHMTSMAIPRLVVSKVLNHAESGVTAVYDRHSYDHEKREGLEACARRLEEITKGETDPQVTKFSQQC